MRRKQPIAPSLRPALDPSPHLSEQGAKTHPHRTMRASPRPGAPQGCRGAAGAPGEQGRQCPQGPAATWEGLTHSAPSGRGAGKDGAGSRVSGTRPASCAAGRRDACLPQSQSRSSACPGISSPHLQTREAFSLPTQPGKRCCPLCEVRVSGTSQGRGIWHMNHSPGWEINYSSKRKTKHFTNCPERKELGKGWKRGIGLDTANMHEWKRRTEGAKVLSGVIQVLLSFWNWGCLFAGLSLQDSTPCSGSGCSRITTIGCCTCALIPHLLPKSLIHSPKLPCLAVHCTPWVREMQVWAL